MLSGYSSPIIRRLFKPAESRFGKGRRAIAPRSVDASSGEKVYRLAIATRPKIADIKSLNTYEGLLLMWAWSVFSAPFQDTRH